MFEAFGQCSVRADPDDLAVLPDPDQGAGQGGALEELLELFAVANRLVMNTFSIVF